MAEYGSSDPYPYPWGGSLSSQEAERPDLNHKISSISGVSSLGTNESGHRDSVVSLTSPIEGPSRSYSNDGVDISRVRISSTGSSGISSPNEGSRNQSRSSFLPDTLRVGGPTSPTTRGFNPFRTSTQSYEPISAAGSSTKPTASSRPVSKRFSKRRSGSSLSLSHGPIIEGEEIDMSLLGSAMPMGFSNYKTAYATVQEEEREDAPILSPMAFDVSSFTGPPQNEEQLKEVNRQEAAGILTGGLGVGLKPGTTISSTDLYANAPETPRTPGAIGRRLSFRAPSFRRQSFRTPGLARAATLRELGQSEANKRGEIIEVIVEEPTVDLSSFSGGDSTPLGGTSTPIGGTSTPTDFDQMEGPRQAPQSAVPAATVEVFYPQADWKPFSMRWPYLTGLITLSVILADVQEYLLQRSNKAPLYQFTSAELLSTWDYFSFKYLPTIIAVSFGVLWQVTDFEVKRLEAYYQLSKDGGALAAESINVDYITFFNFLRPLRALKYKHYAVAVSSVATLIAVSLVPILQSNSFQLRPDPNERQASPGEVKGIHVVPAISRALSVVLILIALLGMVLVYLLERRRSGLVADVKGIAGIAAMANRSHILMDFKNMDTATPELIHQTLKSHRYSLRNSSLAPEDKVPLTQEEKDKYDQQTRQENPHPLMLRTVAGIPFIIGMLLFMLLIPVVLFNSKANIITDKAPFLLTGFAVLIKLVWGTLETDVRMIEPFYILSRRHASPKVLTLDYTAMVWGWMPIQAFLNGHFLVGLVGLGSVLAEVLTVCSTSFANVYGEDFITKAPPPGVDAGEETHTSFWLSFGFAMGIITFLCFVAVFVYSRRRHPFLPRQPNTIASILAFIHQSKMLYDFVGTEKMNNAQMVQRLGSIGKTYGLGWFTGRDGEMHCGVDEEELVSNYKHGDDARKASQPWSTNWDNY
jgi:hypothetical protein